MLGMRFWSKYCDAYLYLNYFNLFQDESSLIWISSSGERRLKLASIIRIIPGQRTVRFYTFYLMLH